jgi:monofunctional biosynthetic peptidoglycan transglycosylase
MVLVWQVWLLGNVVWLRYYPPSSTAFMDAQRASQSVSRPIDYRWVPYASISVHAKRAVVAAEDSGFMAHGGFDWKGIENAFQRNLKKGRIVAGGSTITQQLAKNLFLSASRNPLRKAQEAVVTVMLEACLDKRRILELYLNVIEWGNNLYGIEAASRHYFKVPAARLSPAQAARLAAMIPNPKYFQARPASRALSLRASIYSRRLYQVAIPR